MNQAWRANGAGGGLGPRSKIVAELLCAVQRRLIFSGFESHPATVAPAGSNRSSSGGNETAEASGVEGHFGDSASM